MEINNWVHKIHALAVEKGWWVDKEEEMQETKTITPEAKLAKHMLFVGEIGEASEQVRDGLPHFYRWNDLPGNGERGIRFDDKPEGEAVELADCVIRIMDYFGFMGWDLEKTIQAKHEFNVCRAFRHGGKVI